MSPTSYPLPRQKTGKDNYSTTLEKWEHRLGSKTKSDLRGNLQGMMKPVYPTLDTIINKEDPVKMISVFYRITKTDTNKFCTK